MVYSIAPSRRRFRPRFFILLLALALFSSAVYGFAAANTVADSGAGDGAEAISGYTISNIGYTLDSDDPPLLDSMTFDIKADTAGVDIGTIKVRLDESTSTWYSCSESDGVARCDLSGTDIKVVDADNLRVVAVSNYQ